MAKKPPKIINPEAIAKAIGRYAHAGVMALIDMGVKNGAPLVGWEAKPIQRDADEMKQLALMQLDAEKAMVAMLAEILGALAYHPALLYALAAGAIIGTSYDFKRIEGEVGDDGENDGNNGASGELKAAQTGPDKGNGARDRPDQAKGSGAESRARPDRPVGPVEKSRNTGHRKKRSRKNNHVAGDGARPPAGPDTG